MLRSGDADSLDGDTPGGVGGGGGGGGGRRRSEFGGDDGAKESDLRGTNEGLQKSISFVETQLQQMRNQASGSTGQVRTRLLALHGRLGLGLWMYTAD